VYDSTPTPIASHPPSPVDQEGAVPPKCPQYLVPVFGTCKLSKPMRHLGMYVIKIPTHFCVFPLISRLPLNGRTPLFRPPDLSLLSLFIGMIECIKKRIDVFFFMFLKWKDEIDERETN